MLSSIRVRTGCLQLSALISDLLQGCGFLGGCGVLGCVFLGGVVAFWVVFFLGGAVAFWVVFFFGGVGAFFSPETFTSFHFLIL